MKQNNQSNMSKQNKPVTPQRILSINAKCSDLCAMSLQQTGQPTKEHDGYVPNWFPNPNAGHYGDYVTLDIDLETGHILNWKKPTEAQLGETFGH